MHCRPNQVLPTVMHPTKCCKVDTFSTYEVPHVHPQHTTIVNNQMYQHKHYFPQSQSMVDSVSHQHFNCGQGPGPGGAPGQMGPMGPMGPMGGPGFGPFGPGR
ncbi:spore coat protein CotD [Bacillus salacetis]|uniref:Spore coat protein CotD n=1 Tax=Bacillus salacetis TaxID=2315464 RepID=A0A3A1R2S2_9BACI|nr:CotD family spore coat protein [Bacillus salacetis]RIW33104.1 spore coat protein CotD [Bacillus salacetis]